MMVEPLTDKELQRIQEAWPSFKTLGTARWHDLGERLLATVARLEGEKAALGKRLEACSKERHYARRHKQMGEGDTWERCDAGTCLLDRAALSGAGEGWLPGGLDRDAIRKGVKAAKEGRVTPWEDVERELGLGGSGCPRR